MIKISFIINLYIKEKYIKKKNKNIINIINNLINIKLFKLF